VVSLRLVQVQVKHVNPISRPRDAQDGIEVRPVATNQSATKWFILQIRWISSSKSPRVLIGDHDRNDILIHPFHYLAGSMSPDIEEGLTR
jgi:hypothetical protein